MSFHCGKWPHHLSLSFAVLVHTVLCCPTMSVLQRRSGFPINLTPFIYHSVLSMVTLLSFIRAMCPAYFHFACVAYSAMSVTLVLCLAMILLTYSCPSLPVEHRPSTTPRHRTLFCAALAIPLQLVPCCFSSASVLVMITIMETNIL